MSGPAILRWTPHLAVLVVALLLAILGTEDMSIRVAGAADALLLVAALRWPLPAFATSFVALGFFSLHEPFVTYQGWAWTVHAGLLLLVGLRNTVAVLAIATALSAALLLGLQIAAGDDFGPWRYTAIVLIMFTSAVVFALAATQTRLARARAAQSDAALAHARAQQMLLTERARIARELHDVVAHHMSVIAIQAEAAPYRMTDPPDELTAVFADIRVAAVDGLTELRRLLGVLRSTDDDEGRPQPTLDGVDGLLSSVRAAGVDVTSTVRGDVRKLPDGVELSAFRIVQESLSNVLKHAPEACAEVVLVYSPTALTIRIVNGAPKSAVTSPPGAGHGLLGMRERVAMLDGDFRASETSDGGFAVDVTLPSPIEEPRS